MILEKIKNNSNKILVFIINLLIMTVAFLVIKENNNPNRDSVTESTDVIPTDQIIGEVEEPVIEEPAIINEDDKIINTNNNSPNKQNNTNVGAKTNINQNKNNSKTNSNKNSTISNSNTNSTNKNTNSNINRRTRTS